MIAGDATKLEEVDSPTVPIKKRKNRLVEFFSPSPSLLFFFLISRLLFSLSLSDPRLGLHLRRPEREKERDSEFIECITRTFDSLARYQYNWDMALITDAIADQSIKACLCVR